MSGVRLPAMRGCAVQHVQRGAGSIAMELRTRRGGAQVKRALAQTRSVWAECVSLRVVVRAHHGMLIELMRHAQSVTELVEQDRSGLVSLASGVELCLLVFRKLGEALLD